MQGQTHTHTHPSTHIHTLWSLAQESKTANSRAPKCWHSLQAWVQTRDPTPKPAWRVSLDHTLLRVALQGALWWKRREQAYPSLPTPFWILEERRWGGETGGNRSLGLSGGEDAELSLDATPFTNGVAKSPEQGHLSREINTSQGNHCSIHKQELPTFSRKGLSSQAKAAVSANKHSKTTKPASKLQRLLMENQELSSPLQQLDYLWTCLWLYISYVYYK